ncbi:MAG TPA: hypothetical protein VHD62_11070, partial [Opitutaceae bacterium]|nr:hypothetical protein [Opitutaceae bacterium]
MNPGCPQTLDFQVSEASFPTRNPDDPVVGVDVLANVTVTLKWNAAGTALEPAGIDTKDPDKNGVTYDDPEWQNPGPGPFDIFDDAIGGNLRRVGRVTWSIKTRTRFEKQTNAATHQTRVGVQPFVQLVRTIERDGTPPQIEVTDSRTSEGFIYSNWA